MDRWTWGQAGQLVWWWTWQTDTFSQHAHHGCQQTPVFKRVPNIHDAQTVWLLLAQSHNHWHLSDRAMSWYMEFFDFWFCLLRGTWLFLLMGSRCQTKNLQAVLTLDATQDLCSTAANIQYGIQSFYGIQFFYCLALQRSHFPSCAGHEKQLLAEQNGEIIVQDAGRPSRAGSRCQTFHRANRCVTFDIRNNWWNDTRRQLQQGFCLWLSSF